MVTKSRQYSLVWLVLTAASLLPGRLCGQGLLDQTSRANDRPVDSVVAFEGVDPLSGALSLTFTDLVLPGPAGLDLAVVRTYSSKIFPQYASGITGLEERSWVGVGWRLHFGRVIHSESTDSGLTAIELADGSRHPLFHTTAYPEGWITKELWRYNRSTATLLLPNGRAYVFGQVTTSTGQLGTLRYVTEIRDAYNNRLSFTYFAAPGPTDGVSRIEQILSPTETRNVTFTYNATTNSLETMVFNGRTWTYDTTASSVSGHVNLWRVRPPAGPPWQFEYRSSQPGPELTSVTIPEGGRLAYTYDDVAQTIAGGSVTTRSVVRRDLSGRALPSTMWSYAYGQGAQHDETRVSTPCGVTSVYRFLGVGGTAGHRLRLDTTLTPPGGFNEADLAGTPAFTRSRWGFATAITADGRESSPSNSGDIDSLAQFHGSWAEQPQHAAQGVTGYRLYVFNGWDWSQGANGAFHPQLNSHPPVGIGGDPGPLVIRYVDVPRVPANGTSPFPPENHTHHGVIPTTGAGRTTPSPPMPKVPALPAGSRSIDWK